MSIPKISLMAILIFLLVSCMVFSTSMTPSQINGELPKFTKSTLIHNTDGKLAEETGKCKVIVKGRKYTAPIGLTVKGDLKNGARGIDEWVELDGGNAFVLKNYQ